jgi:hypothetical protein
MGGRGYLKNQRLSVNIVGDMKVIKIIYTVSKKSLTYTKEKEMMVSCVNVYGLYHVCGL